MSSDLTYGFDDITPDAPAAQGRGLSTQEIDRLAQRHGFVSREPQEVPIKRQRGTEDSVHQFTMRVRVRAWNRFVLFCEERRLSYREGFDLIIAHLDKIAAS